jgi:hypothetical protein
LSYFGGAHAFCEVDANDMLYTRLLHCGFRFACVLYSLPGRLGRPLMIAVGEPLIAREGESVDAFHERYMEALKALFDKYVPYSPNPNVKLIIQ